MALGMRPVSPSWLGTFCQEISWRRRQWQIGPKQKARFLKYVSRDYCLSLYGGCEGPRIGHCKLLLAIWKVFEKYLKSILNITCPFWATSKAWHACLKKKRWRKDSRSSRWGARAARVGSAAVPLKPETVKVGLSFTNAVRKHTGVSENRVYSQWNRNLIGIMIINHWV